jgi:hypothetical protein
MATASFVTDLTEIITQAVEAAAMIGSLWSSFGVVDQAQQYYNLYAAQRNFYYNTFQTGAEAPLAQIVYRTPYPMLSYATAAGYLYNTPGFFAGQIANPVPWWSRHAAMFGTTPSARIQSDELQQDYNLIQTQWVNVMFRFEEWYFDTLSDLRWDHRMKLHNVGLKKMSTVLSALASSVGQREDVMTAQASYLAGITNSAAEKRGLAQGHRDVQQLYGSFVNSAGSTYATPRTGVPARSTKPTGSDFQTFPYGTMPGMH